MTFPYLFFPGVVCVRVGPWHRGSISQSLMVKAGSVCAQTAWVLNSWRTRGQIVMHLYVCCMTEMDSFFRRAETRQSFSSQHTDLSLIFAVVYVLDLMDRRLNGCEHAKGGCCIIFHFLPAVTDMDPDRLRIWKRVLPPSLVVLVNVSV